MSDLRKLEEQTEALEQEVISKYLKRARYYAAIALSTAEGSGRDKERAEFIKTVIAAIDDALDPYGDLEEEFRKLMEGEDDQST